MLSISQAAQESNNKCQQTLTFESSITYVRQNNVKPILNVEHISQAYLHYGFTLPTTAWKVVQLSVCKNGVNQTNCKGWWKLCPFSVVWATLDSASSQNPLVYF